MELTVYPITETHTHRFLIISAAAAETRTRRSDLQQILFLGPDPSGCHRTIKGERPPLIAINFARILRKF